VIFPSQGALFCVWRYRDIVNSLQNFFSCGILSQAMEEKMKTIQTNAYIKQPGRLILDIPEDIPLGEHKIVVVIDEKTEPEKKKSLLGLWKEYGRAPGSKKIEEMRKEVWENFPRKDI
jgi:hypothetical protein